MKLAKPILRSVLASCLALALLAVVPLANAGLCADDPDFEDKHLRDCEAYEAEAMCLGGGVDPDFAAFLTMLSSNSSQETFGWTVERHFADSVAPGEASALEACCACGGGIQQVSAQKCPDKNGNEITKKKKCKEPCVWMDGQCYKAAEKCPDKKGNEITKKKKCKEPCVWMDGQCYKDDQATTPPPPAAEKCPDKKGNEITKKKKCKEPCVWLDGQCYKDDQATTPPPTPERRLQNSKTLLVDLGMSDFII